MGDRPADEALVAPLDFTSLRNAVTAILGQHRAKLPRLAIELKRLTLRVNGLDALVLGISCREMKPQYEIYRLDWNILSMLRRLAHKLRWYD